MSEQSSGPYRCSVCDRGMPREETNSAGELGCSDEIECGDRVRTEVAFSHLLELSGPTLIDELKRRPDARDELSAAIAEAAKLEAMG